MEDKFIVSKVVTIFNGMTDAERQAIISLLDTESLFDELQRRMKKQTAIINQMYSIVKGGKEE